MEIKRISSKQIKRLKKQLDIYEGVKLRVVTGSMAPVINPNDEIVVSSINKMKRSLSRFDIVLFLWRDILVCHYVSHINQMKSPDGNSFIITRGLNSPSEDLPVYKQNQIGIVVSHKIPWWLRLKLTLFNG